MDYKDNYLKWKEALFGTEYSELLDAMTEEEQEESFFQSLKFGTAGMRGVMGLGTNRLNIFTVRRAAKGFAQYICSKGGRDRSIVIAYDSRNNSALFAKESALTLAKNGVTVYLFDQLQSVPLLSFAIRKLGCAGGIVITASHNHKKYNGFKVYGDDGGQVSVADAREITAQIHAIEDYFSIEAMEEQDAIQKGLLKIIGKEIDESYYAIVNGMCFGKELVKKHADELKVVYTPLFGSGYRHVTRLFEDIGVKNLICVEEQIRPDGEFPGLAAPNPEFSSTFALSVEYAKECGADFIIATDPDCDRMGVTVREADGSYLTLTGNLIGCLLMDYIFEHHKDETAGKFTVKSIVTTQLAGRIAQYYGVEMKEVLTGFRFVSEIMRTAPEGSFLYAFEESYGYLEADFIRDKDGAMSAAFLVQAAAYHLEHGRTLRQAVDWLYEKYGWYLEDMLSVTVEGMEGMRRIAGFIEKLRQAPPEQIGGMRVTEAADLQKGYRGLPKADVLIFELEGGSRVVLRPSGTEPRMKAYCFVNASVKTAAKEKLKLLRDALSVMLEKIKE